MCIFEDYISLEYHSDFIFEHDDEVNVFKMT